MAATTKLPRRGAEGGGTELEVIKFYADNEIYLVEISFSVSGGEWNEFQKSQLFRDLMAYDV